MKAVLLSTRPKWCEKICHKIAKNENGKSIYAKTIEIRKTKPSIYTPFKVLIYQTKSRDNAIYKEYKVDDLRSGKVIGEFVCDWIAEYDCELYNDGSDEEIRSVWYDEDDGERYTEIIAHTGGRPWLLRKACMSWDEFKAYMGEGEKTFYAWHISDLKIYDKPKPLEEFYIRCRISDKKCRLCDNCFEREDSYGRYYAVKKLTRAPESWCYVE